MRTAHIGDPRITSVESTQRRQACAIDARQRLAIAEGTPLSMCNQRASA